MRKGVKYKILGYKNVYRVINTKKNKIMKLLYLAECTWEYDFITKDILNNFEFDIETFKVNEFRTLLNRHDVVENNILVININCAIHDILEVVNYIKPLIIFYMSDEFGDYSSSTILEQYTKLLFLQYNHSHYQYNHNNTYQLPLGYVTNFLDKKSSLSIPCKTMKERKINCSFIGDMKSDRAHMSNVFKNNMENTNILFVNNSWNMHNLTYSPQKCFEIYNNSIFVISGRGNQSLDCFRIYEAIVSGSIPVVVGSYSEINNTFYYNNDMPPIVHDESWEAVVVKCNNLLNNPEELQKLQCDLLLWWRNKILSINTLISNVINNIE